MPTGPLIFSFSDATVAEGNRLAGSLAQTLRDIGPDISVERQRERPDTQDFGATLVVILGTTAVTALAKGIATWLARNSGASVEVKRDGNVVLSASHLDSQDVARIAEALSQSK